MPMPKFMMISFIVANTKKMKLAKILKIYILLDGELIIFDFFFYLTTHRSATKLNHFFQLKHSDVIHHLRLLYYL